MELLPEEGAADWQDIKHDRNQCESVNSVKNRQTKYEGIE